MCVLLSHIAREPRSARQNSKYQKYIDKSLDVLTAMEESHVARKIGDYAREILSFLRNDAVLANPSHLDGQDGEFNQFEAFPDAGTFLFSHANEYDMGFNNFNFFDGSFSAFHAGTEEDYGIFPRQS
jgi:hypothetical protein